MFMFVFTMSSLKQEAFLQRAPVEHRKQCCSVQTVQVQYSAAQYSAVNYSAAQYSAVHYSAVKHSAMQCCRILLQ